MNRSSLRVRVILLFLFAFLTLPCLTYLAVSVPGLSPLLAVDMALRAVPLYAAVWVDHLFFDGGELTPVLVPVWVLLTGALLWPLLLMGIRPALWRVQGWRRGIAAYSACAAAATVAAASWVFTHMGYFF